MSLRHNDQGLQGTPGEGEERARFQARLLDAMGQAVIATDPQGKVIYWNRAAEELYGWSEEEAKDRPIMEITPSVEMLGRAEEIMSGLLAGRSWSGEFEVKRKDGTTFPVRVTDTPVHDERGNLVAILGVSTDITERKVAEEALKESEQRYRAVIEQTTEGIYLGATDTKMVLESNAAFQKMLGYSAQELRGMHIYDFVAHDQESIDSVFRDVLDRGHAFIHERRYCRKDGSVADVETSATLISYYNREVVCTVVRDVTERKKAEEALRRSEERSRSSFRDAAIGMALVGTDGRWLQVNRSLCEMLGYSEEELLGKTFQGVTHPDDLDADLDHVRRMLSGEIDTYQMQKRYLHADGHMVWILLSVSMVHDEEGEPLYFVSQIQDITERKEAEEKIGEAEERYRTLVERMPAIVYIQEPGDPSRTTYVSPQNKAILGYSPEECMTTPDHWVKITHPDDQDRVLEEDRRTNETGEPFRTEYRQFTRDGRTVWLRDEASLVRDREGRALYWLGVQLDITERKDAEEARKEAEERYRTVVEVQTELICRFLPDLTLTFVNEAYRSYFGNEWEELIGESFIGRVAPEDRVLYGQRLVQLTRENPTRTIEHRVLTPGGGVCWHQWTDTAIFDGEGHPVEYQSVGRDVTDRKRAEQEVLKSEAGLAETQRLAHLGGWEWDIKTDEVYWSDEVYRIYGFAPQGFVPSLERFMEVVHPNDRGLIEGVIDNALNGYEPYDLEHRIVKTDGEVGWVHRRAEVFRDEAGEPLRMVGTVQDVTERRVLEERLEHQALHDPLTDLPNRSLFLDRLGHALRRTGRKKGRRTAVLFLDLNNFKSVNDSLGHEVGDLLLVAVAGRLTGCLRPEDTLARFGGDEFVVLVEDVEAPDEPVRVAERIADGFRSPFVLGGNELYVRASIGIAMGGERTKNPGDLLRDADTAMYRAKEEGSGYSVFDPAMHDQVLSRLELENDLRHALENGEFTLYYQPKFRLGHQDRIEQVETLVRWEHPQRGFMLPDDFLPIAREMGLIIPIDGWVMKEACRQAKEWQQRYPSEPPLSVGVNLSAGQVRNPGLLQEVRSALRESGLEADNLILEITEGTLLKDTQEIETVLGEVKALGVRLEIDDFGKEYSSLSYLNRLPVDGLKIDRLFLESFGENPSNLIIVEAVISLAHSLGLEVTGEGVQSAEQLELLRGMGCDFVQGYHLARPLPKEGVEQLLADLSTELRQHRRASGE